MRFCKGKFLFTFAALMGLALVFYSLASIEVIKSIIFMPEPIRQAIYTSDSLAITLQKLFEAVYAPDVIIYSLICGGLFLCGSVIYLFMLHSMWKIFPPGFARTTPTRAVGFLFVPVLNVFWVFVVHWGWAVDYNRLLEEKKIRTTPLPEWLFLAYAVIFLCTFIPDFGISIRVAAYVFALIVMTRICYALDALKEHSSLAE